MSKITLVAMATNNHEENIGYLQYNGYGCIERVGEELVYKCHSNAFLKSIPMGDIYEIETFRETETEHEWGKLTDAYLLNDLDCSALDEVKYEIMKEETLIAEAVDMARFELSDGSIKPLDKEYISFLASVLCGDIDAVKKIFMIKQNTRIVKLQGA